MALNEKGQAAVTDALYFLTIVVGLSSFLFVFAVTYGNLVDAKINQTYEVDYTTSALKTVFYSSAPRDATKTLATEGACKTDEIDYLLALVKEDYLNGADINETNRLLSKNVRAVMRPLEKSHDYLFYMFDNLGNPVFVFMHSAVDGAGEARDYEDSFFYCRPSPDIVKYGAGDSALRAIQRFTSGIGEIAPSTIESLFYYKTGETTNEKKISSRLLIWPAKAIDETQLNCCNASDPTDCCDRQIVVDEQYYCNPAFEECVD